MLYYKGFTVFRWIGALNYSLSTGSALEDLNLDEPLNIAASLDRELEGENNSLSNSISSGLANSGKKHFEIVENEWSTVGECKLS